MNSFDGSCTRWLISWTKEAKKLYIFGAFLSILNSGCFVCFSWYISEFAAWWLIHKQTLPHNLRYAAVFLIGRYVFAHFSSIINYKAGNVIVAAIKIKLYPKLLKNHNIDSISSNLLVTRVSDDLKPFYSFFIPYAIASVLIGLFLLFICFWFEIWVGIILFIMILIIPLLITMIGTGAESLHKKHITLFIKYSSVFYNRLQTIAEIANLDNINSQYQFLSKKSKTLNKATTSVMKIAILSSAVLELFVTIAIAAIAIYLGMNLLGIMPGSNYGKGYSFKNALFLLMLTPYFFHYVRKFVSAYHDKNKAMASAKMLIPFLIDKTETPTFNDKTILQTFEIKNLHFTYPNSLIKALSNIHIQMPTKGLVLVKGISGSGKSTLLKIISGCICLQDGTISVNGRNNLWSAHWLKTNSSYMNQFPFIFDGTLHYNVFLNNETEEKYPEFLNKILAKKKEGWNTKLSHNGKQLSGGEKQLVTLARMLLYPKPIAILDEPTANLDSETIEIILEHIVGFAQNKLVVIASHDEKFNSIASKVVNLNWGEQINYE